MPAKTSSKQTESLETLRDLPFAAGQDELPKLIGAQRLGPFLQTVALLLVGHSVTQKALTYSYPTGNRRRNTFNSQQQGRTVMSVKPIPEGYHSITPYLGIQKAAEAIEFYKKAFGATEVMRLSMPDGGIGHAELRIGDCPIMLGTPCDQGPLSNPDTSPSVGLHLYVTDVDKSYKQAIAAGGTVVSEVKDQFYGDRSGTLKDPYGHLWFLATRKEDLTQEQIEQRAKEMFQQG
ncbi:putative glyoxalase superfamily protein PhnB [Pseudomonas silensiensis]|nr:putative glyoxalase superfamily protein PhnB [Pseudomonas silensiensis]